MFTEAWLNPSARQNTIIEDRPSASRIGEGATMQQREDHSQATVLSVAAEEEIGLDKEVI